MASTTSKPFTGRHMLLISIAFFAVVIAANLTMAISSARTWTGLVVTNSYVASQNFQTVQDTIARQVAAGWTLQVSYADGLVRFAALDGDGAPLALTGVSAFLRRPVGGHDDTTIALHLQDNQYVAAIDLPAGVWDVTVSTDSTPLGTISYEHRVMAR
ncbi:FixH family protein [Devosia beringensis]|uniref:FixH family protein n=1 Tax=Devosia beringensis TaxID=2657486 RepID=UPI00186B8A43|nr:FixH family protein [Devosia beringensis]